MQPILQHLFQVSALEDISQERLESFVQEHPSFGIAHFLLSRKLQAEGSSRFPDEAQRTCLYFSNPFWLQWLLENQDGTPKTAERAIETPVARGAVVAEPVADAPVMIPEQTVAGEPGTIPDKVVTEEPATLPEEIVTEGSEAVPVELIPEEPVPAEPAGGGAENVVTVAEQAYPETRPEDDPAGTLSAGEPEPETGSEGPAAEQLLRSIEEAKELRGALQKLNGDLSVETSLAGERLEEQAPAPVASIEKPIRDEEPPFVLEESTEEAPSPARQEAAPAPTAGSQDILFEPYHTIDYFASQGIKLTLEDNPPDTLGKQLKSFTEWLKSMRRLPQKDREVVADRVAEEAIQTIAAHSIEGKDVLTETMAEVLVKQGMRERARAVYEKLSLLDPDKSAYFAAKIEQLNIS
jgi:hypothetical protein